jgi:hypothetical protein
MRPGRKTDSSRPEPAATQLRPLPIPPSTLTKAERLRFLEITDCHLHLRAGDAILLAAFVRASLKFEDLSNGNDIVAWEKAGRMMLALARGLKLVSTTAARTLVRMREDHRPNLAALYLAENPEDSDDAQQEEERDGAGSHHTH